MCIKSISIHVLLSVFYLCLCQVLCLYFFTAAAIFSREQKEDNGQGINRTTNHIHPLYSDISFTYRYFMDD